MPVSLVIRRRIQASRMRLFEAWINPIQLLQWWGPKGVRCSHAEVEPRVGGKLRIGNELADGRTLWISGEFLEFVPGERLVYTWRIEPVSSGTGNDERVTVRFETCGEAQTDVIVIHEQIADEATRDGHAAGWEGCFDGLESFSTGPT
jgi:uncharacterized protein YndB with AHSA1/START domain